MKLKVIFSLYGVLSLLRLRNLTVCMCFLHFVCVGMHICVTHHLCSNDTNMDIKHDADIDTSVPGLIRENGISEGNNMCWCYIELTLFDFLYTTVCCGLVDHPHKCHVHVINMLHTG